MTVDELNARMSSQEFTDWLQFFEWRQHLREEQQQG